MMISFKTSFLRIGQIVASSAVCDVFTVLSIQHCL